MHNRMMLPIELTKILYSSWEGEISTSSKDSEIYGKCLNGHGSVTFKNGNKYDGEFVNGLLHGKGTFKWLNGIIYEGQFQDNRITGLGIYKWIDGSVYEGEVKDGLRHGKGKYTVGDAVYEGEWVNGKKHGRGKIQFKSGSIFEGEFKDDLKDGFGKMYYYPSGNYFEGQWRKDQKEGTGTMNWVDIREKYVGQWSKNTQEGWGVHLWLESKGEGKFMRNRYEGYWRNGVREGFGTFYYANGSKYEGFWADNMKEGHAFYTNENGRTDLVLFHQDRMIRNDKQAVFTPQEKKAASKKQIEPNYYSLCLNINWLYEPSMPSLDQLYNVLLRNNTQLKSWYKALCQFYEQQSEYSFCLNLEGAWRMVRSLKLLGRFSLACFNRGLKDVTVDIQSMLQGLNKGENQVSFESLYYHQEAQSAEALEPTGQNNDEPPNIDNVQGPIKPTEVHNKNRNLLFREFVHLLVWMGHKMNPVLDKPQKSFQWLMGRITPFLDSLAKPAAKGSVMLNDNMSDNKSSMSKNEKSVPQFFKQLNNLAMKTLASNKPQQSIGRDDMALTLRQFIGYGLLSQSLGEAQFSLLEKIFQKYMDPQVFSQPRELIWGNSTLSTKILALLDYELIEYEFVELLYVLIVKKLPSHKQTEDNKLKYQGHINLLLQAKQTHQDTKKQESQFTCEKLYFKSAKAVKRDELRELRQKMEEEKQRQEAVLLEKEKERAENEQMAQEDHDVKDQELDEQSQFEI